MSAHLDDYTASAELFGVNGLGKRAPLFYMRFNTAAEALRFAVEQMPAAVRSPVIEVDDQRFDATEMLEIYEAAGYPLERGERLLSLRPPGAPPQA